ncbi:GDSL-type esterase/lipase family protein [Planobispora siamensis]|nr:GDSL-type esterase/lipase family protein [Planobispora siamensis]
MSRAAGVLAMLIVVLAPVPAQAASPAPAAPIMSATQDPHPAPDPPPQPVAAVEGAVEAAARDRVLGAQWRRSADRAWTTIGDASGFHVLVATERSGYAWRTVATLAEPGFDADQWIGNACLTRSGRHAVVVYAPRTFTNREELFNRGAFTAVVDLADGRVRKVAVQSSIAYHNPGCGDGESAVLSQGGGERMPKTRLFRLDAATARLGRPLELSGQVTSAVPVDSAIVAAAGPGLIKLDAAGRRSELVSAASVPAHLTVDGAGGVVYLEHARGQAQVRRLVSTAPGSAAVTLGHGPLTEVGIDAAAGQVYLTGELTTSSALPATVTKLSVPKAAGVSSAGRAALTQVIHDHRPDPRLPARDSALADHVRIDMIATATGSRLAFGLTPHDASAAGRALHPSLLRAAPSAAPRAAQQGDPADPIEEERTCAVARNDPRNQATQPKPRQVEWAADQAVRGALTVPRESNWKGLGMPAYSPQGLFPRTTLSGVPDSDIPAQVMLGILAQESNLWQASRVALPGVTANPLIGNFYGLSYTSTGSLTDWEINWAEADCGYGVSQMTDGMRLPHRTPAGQSVLPYQTQRAIALDFAANIAAGVQLLGRKWNEVRQAGLMINNGDHRKLENWFYAIWAYNSGFYPESNRFGVDRFGKPNNGAWGVGWANNPLNPAYDITRRPFMEFTYADAAQPQKWPYPEKVLGFAGHPIEAIESPDTLVAGFRPAWWAGDGSIGVQNRRNVKPPVDQFCDASNECNPAAGTAACTRADSKCWYHQSSTWKPDCDATCGNELLRFDPGYPYQGDGASYPPTCSRTGLPGNALVVDNLPASIPSARPGCSHPGSSGSFALAFAGDGSGNYPAKIDFHQLGAGYAGHFYFAHTRTGSMYAGTMQVTGTWTLDRPLSGWMRVLVHLPDHGAHTQQARYAIDTGNGFAADSAIASQKGKPVRYLSQARKANMWVSLGVYPVTGTPRVRLSSRTLDGYGEEDIAFDAVAFQPLPGRPRHQVAVLGDSYAAGEGAGDYYAESNASHGTTRWNACRRSADAWSRKLVLPTTRTPLGQLADDWSTDAELGSVACSGAKTENVRSNSSSAWPRGDGQFREISQIDSGVLTPATTLVLLIIGGNNSDGFSDAIEECSLRRDCQSADTFPEGFLPHFKGLIDIMLPDLEQTIADIRARAPAAEIVLVGYPRLFGTADLCPLYSVGERVALGELAVYLDFQQNHKLLNMPNRQHVSFASALTAFGGQGACGDGGELINNAVRGPKGEGDYHIGDPLIAPCWAWLEVGLCASRESFHPKDSGTDTYAQLIRNHLDSIFYQGHT